MFNNVDLLKNETKLGYSEAFTMKVNGANFKH